MPVPEPAGHDLDTVVALVVFGAADQHLRPFLATVDDGKARAAVCQVLHLFQRRGEGVAILGIAGKTAHANDETLVQHRGDADLAAELVAHPRLTFGDAIDLWLVQSTDFVTALGLLMQQV